MRNASKQDFKFIGQKVTGPKNIYLYRTKRVIRKLLKRYQEDVATNRKSPNREP